MFAKRLRSLRKERQITQTVLAKAMGLSQQAVAKWENGMSSPDPDMLRRLAAYFGVAADALLEDPPPGRPLLKEVRPYLSSLQRQVPILGQVRAGFGLPALEDDLGTEAAEVGDGARYFYLVVQGDSMAPRIREGDLALVRQQPTLEDGDLGVVVYGDSEGTLKRFQRQEDGVVLRSFNPAYEDKVLSGDELEKLFIIGKVVETKARW